MPLSRARRDMPHHSRGYKRDLRVAEPVVTIAWPPDKNKSHF